MSKPDIETNLRLRSAKAEESGPQAWPSAGSLVIDSLPFRVRNPLQPGRAPVAFSVFCAMGYVAGRPRMWPGTSLAS